MNESFGELLKKIRESRKNPSITQAALGVQLDLTQKQIQRYEDNQIPPLDTLIKLCDIFKYDFLSPATGGRCTIIEYYGNTLKEKPDVPPGFKELVDVLLEQNRILKKGFNLNAGLQKPEESPSNPSGTESFEGRGSGVGKYIVPLGQTKENKDNG